MPESLSIVMACVSLAGSVAVMAGGYAVNRSQVSALRAKAVTLEARLDALSAECRAKIESATNSMVSKEMLDLHLKPIYDRVGQVLQMQQDMNRRLDGIVDGKTQGERPHH